MRVRVLAAGIVVVVVGGMQALAHHSFAAEYDVHRPVTLKGVVTKIEWTNPHSHVLLDVTDDKGGTTTWKIELASPMVLIQNGWRAKSIKLGDTIVVDGALAKDQTAMANARLVTLADGRCLSAGSSGGDVPPAQEGLGGGHLGRFR
jgi:Family of unknown function (DUF6152)